MKILIAILFIATLSGVTAVAQPIEVSIIPKPESVEVGNGHFTLDKETRIVARGREDRAIAVMLNQVLNDRYGLTLKITSKGSSDSRNIVFAGGADHIRLNDGYGLWVTPEGIRIEASIPAARFYAVQTLIQLLPVANRGTIRIPAVTVNDAARFRYRGMHLDVARHFLEPAAIGGIGDLA